MRLFRLAVVGLLAGLALPASVLAQATLQIHQINVGWGSSVLVRGPSGTTVLLEAGNTGKGTGLVVPYLRSIGIPPANGLDFTIAGHQHCDHLGGLDEVINAGYNVRNRNFFNGSSTTSSCVTQWNAAAATTTAGAPVVPALGTQIALGNGATLTVIAVNGRIIGGGTVAVSDENDRSIAVLIKYGGFDYLWASDLGGGSETCTGRSTGQVDVETSVIRAISPGGARPMISAGGIDVLYVNHHGSESSTNSSWMNGAAPTVAVINTGSGQGSNFELPRIAVVENVLLSGAACATAPPALVLQTEEGDPAGPETSMAGFSVGDIRIETNGQSTFTVSADGRVTEGPNEVAAAGLPRTFALDDDSGAGDTQAPSTAITSPVNGATLTGTVTVTATASDNVGVTRVEFWLDGALRFTDSTSPYQWSFDTRTVANGSHVLFTQAFDAAGNRGSSANVTVTVNNAGTVVFADDFETDRGWVANPTGTDTAATGQWQRGNPEPTDSNGPKQLGDTASGVNALVTGLLAGTSAGANDVDGGVTSIRSPAIALPASGTLTLSFRFYLAHGSNATSADFLRVRIVSGTTTTTVFQRLGAAADVDAVWAAQSVSLTSFAGQTVRILIEAADAAGASLVEAGVDDVRITQP
jgi:beta-lactamase superfamily II metal-dependent hydrolase